MVGVCFVHSLVAMCFFPGMCGGARPDDRVAGVWRDSDTALSLDSHKWICPLCTCHNTGNDKQCHKCQNSVRPGPVEYGADIRSALKPPLFGNASQHRLWYQHAFQSSLPLHIAQGLQVNTLSFSSSLGYDYSTMCRMIIFFTCRTLSLTI